MPAKIRVVIADDSTLTRELLRALLQEEDDIDVVGEAANGREALDQVRRLRPDVLTLDIIMPIMPGPQAIREIMAVCPLPILVLSSVADAKNAFDCIQGGALDVVMKPLFNASSGAELARRIRVLAKTRVMRHWSMLRPSSTTQPPLEARGTTDLHKQPFHRVFAIAASTGGPQALAAILPSLPAHFPCPVVVAQHVALGFAQGMVDWLSSLCPMPVHLVNQTVPLQAGHIYIAPPERNLCINRQQHLILEEQMPGDIFHPNCDCLLHSVAEVCGAQAVGIILSGMSSDGAKGIARIRQRGGVTLAQDEASSVIFGMNRVAIESGAVQQVLPVTAIADSMQKLAGKST
ncbi:chemotaxis protein CheB [Giesbergeria sinuosa]